MTLLVLLILSTTVTIVVETVYIPSGYIGKISVKSFLKEDSMLRNNSTTEDSHLNITELTSKFGYISEEYKVTTQDGYILGLHRLIKGSRNYNGIPVFLMHGLLDSSDSWVLQGPNALGYLLADEGYDVWMGNARGNRYSLAHNKLTPNQDIFWTFSWEEIGTYDLPAMIDWVLTITNTSSLYYVGHSQGTTSFFVMCSFKPEYRSKIKMMFALSPIAWLSHAESPVLKYISTLPTTGLEYLQFFNTLTPSTDFLVHIYGNMCKVISTGCGDIFEMLFGKNYYVSDAMLPVIIEHASSSSVLQLLHFWQLYKSGRFCRFDHGWMRNLFEYGAFSPPDYDLSGITVPIVLFYSDNDRLSHPIDVAILRGHLSNVSSSYYSQCFSHIDYLYASVAKDAIYEKIILHIKYNEQCYILVFNSYTLNMQKIVDLVDRF